MAQFLSGSWIFMVMMGGAAVSVLVDMLFDYPVRQFMTAGRLLLAIVGV